MDESTIRDAISRTLAGIAPEVSLEQIVATVPLRDQIDLDSMDWLNFIVGLHEQLHVDIPEADYRKLRTLNDLIAYLRAKSG
ncbi:MAG TPA: acyl carrier protein [Burkholderiaceae bacterium]|nr:acyl carrier protein [Burkholderiaceae bacterium]